MTLAIYASDFHGNRFAYESLFTEAIKREIDHVILGGDLTPKWPIIHFSKTLVPYDPKSFRFDDNGETLVDYLEEIEHVIKNRTTEAERYYIKLGGYIVNARILKNWQELLEEQRVLRKLIHKGSITTKSHPTLTAEEWSLIESLIKNDNQTPPFDFKENLKVGRFLTLTDEQKRKALILLYEISRLAKTAGDECLQLLHYYDINPDKLNLMQRNLHKFFTYCLVAAQNHPLNQLIREALSSGVMVEKAQTDFLNNWLVKQIKKYKSARPSARIYLILGNDDTRACLSVVKQMHKKGLIVLIHKDTSELADGFQIAGYPYVRDSGGRFYDAWEKPESEIYQDLISLDQSADPLKTVYVIHTPPAFCALDTSYNNQHFGSQGVRQWLENSPKHLVLSGHIHEAPFINDQVWQQKINGTLCMQPGGWHDENLCAVIFDITKPEQSEWIVPAKHLK